MFPHRRDQHLVREFEKFLIKLTGYGDGVLNQVIYNVHKLLIGQNAATDLLCRRGDFAFYCFVALSEINDHLSRFQEIEIIIG